MRWTGAPGRPRPCPRQGARGRGQERSSPAASCGPRCPGGPALIRAVGQSLPGTAEPFAPRPGALSPPSPPRWPIAPGIYSEFPVSPHLGREPRSRRSSGNTPGLQRFPRNKETDRQRSVLLIPPKEKAHPWSPAPGPQKAGGPGAGSGRGDPPRGTPRHSLLRPMSQGRGATFPAARSRPPPAPTEGALPGPARGVPPAGGRTCCAGAAHTWPHLQTPPPSAGGGEGDAWVVPWRPDPSFRAWDPRPRLRRETRPARRSPAGLPARRSPPLARPPLPPLPPPPRPPAELASSSVRSPRFNPGRRCRSAQGDTPKRGPGAPRAPGGDGAGRREEEFLPGKARGALLVPARGVDPLELRLGPRRVEGGVGF